MSRNQNVLMSKNGFKSSFLLVESGSVQFKSPISNRYCIVDERIIKIELDCSGDAGYMLPVTPVN